MIEPERQHWIALVFVMAVPTQPLVSILSNVSLDPNVRSQNKFLRRMQ